MGTRDEDASRLKKAGCARCKSNHIQPGPDYDRMRYHCLDCGHRARYVFVKKKGKKK